MPDLFKPTKPDKSLHALRWNQSEIEARHFIEHLTVENDIVFDPFMGSGTFGIAALKLGRQFIGCEIDKQTFETAEANIKTASGETKNGYQ
ncbi:MAG TPA: site-specific DNA-methyltransferase [Nitrososphaeraceae archaeon]|nr:site-specific DNA-methyltransferase [Nitrososphaeraceae archaeon]